MKKQAGQAPWTWFVRFTGGPLDGTEAMYDASQDLIPPPEVFDKTLHPQLEGGHYKRTSLSELPGDRDLTAVPLARGAQYQWEGDEGEVADLFPVDEYGAVIVNAPELNGDVLQMRIGIIRKSDEMIMLVADVALDAQGLRDVLGL